MIHWSLWKHTFPCGSARDGLADNRFVTMPEPVNATQKVALDAIWDLLLRGGRWAHLPRT